MSTRICLLSCAAALLTACATPKPVLKVADQGVATVGLAEASLRDYMSLTNAQLSARTDIVRQQTQKRARDNANRQLLVLQSQRAGVPLDDEGAKLIRTLGDERRKIREESEAEQERIAKEFVFNSATLGDVPADKLATVRKSFSVLAQELSPEEWIALSTGYIKEIAAGVESLKKPATPAQPEN